MKYPGLPDFQSGQKLIGEGIHTELIEVRALSWKQPFASLMLHGKIETRVWPTSYRGLVLICTSKLAYNANQLENISGDHQVDRIMLMTIQGKLPAQPHGHAIAIGELIDCRPMTPADEDQCYVQYKADKELWCHVYANVRTIQPFPWKGVQKWKALTADEKRQIIF